jgi:hypothetical protein
MSPAFLAWTTKLADCEGLEMFTDWHEFQWAISSDGRRAVPLFGPADSDGNYHWAAARAIGQEVDSAKSAAEYVDPLKGPCQSEVFTFLTNRVYRRNRRGSTVIVRPQSR